MVFFFFLSLVSESRQTTSKLRLSDIFLRPDIVQSKDNYDSLVRGMLTQHAQGQDQFFTTEVFDSGFDTVLIIVFIW